MRTVTYMKNKILAAAALLLCLPLLASAHQPRLVSGTVIDVPDPEVSKAYYGRLAGEPHLYRIASATPFHLYVNVLVPDVPGAKKDVSAAILKDGDAEHPLAVLGGPEGEWTAFHEEFGNDDYFQAEEFRQDAAPGNYEIRVWSSNNDSAYSLAIGETEAFPPSEIWNAIMVMPKIKSGFFEKPAYTAYLSPFVLPVILTPVALLGAAVTFLIIRKRKKKPTTP